jgi:WD40 repeat protein
MKKITTFLILLALLASVGERLNAADPIAIENVQRNEAVSFEKEILPILQKNCLACHSAKEKQGNLVLESPQDIIKGGDAGTAAVPGKGNESLIVSVASHRLEPIMPPKGNDVSASNLTPVELGLLKLWIDQGVKGSGGIDALSPKKLQALPSAVQPVQAISLTDDGQYVALNRGNQILLYHVPTGQLVSKFTDPALDSDGAKGVAHSDIVQSLSFNIDGNMLASGGFREVKLWRRPSDVQRLNVALGAAASAMAVSPNREWIAVADANQSIRLFRLENGQPGATLNGHTAKINALKFTSSSKQLVSGSVDQSVRIWNLADGSLQGTIETSGQVGAIELLDSTKSTEQQPLPLQKLITGDQEKNIHVWDIPKSAPNKIATSLANITKTVVSRDGTLLGMLDNASNLRIVSLVESKDQPIGKELATWTVDKGVTAFAFILLPKTTNEPSSQHVLLTGSSDGTIRIWNLPEHNVVLEWRGDAKSVTSIAVTADGTQAASGHENGVIAFWQLMAQRPSELFHDVPSPIGIVALSPSRKQLAFAAIKDGKQTVVLRNLENNQQTATFQDPSVIRELAFSIDEGKLIAACDDKKVRIWNLQNVAQGPMAAFDVASVATAVASNQDASQILVGFADNTLRLINAADGMTIKEFAGSTGAILRCGFYANQPYSIAADKSIRFWNAADGVQTRIFNAPSGITSISLSPDGSRMALAGDDKQVRIFQTDNGAVLQTLPATSEVVANLSFSNDNQRLAGLSKNGQLAIWNVLDGRIRESSTNSNLTTVFFGADPQVIYAADKQGRITQSLMRLIRHFEGNTQPISSLVLTANAQTLFASSMDGSLRGYNTQNGQASFTTNHGAAIHSMAISPNEQMLATAGANAIVRLWQTNGNALGVQQLTGFVGSVTTVDFSLDNTKVIAGSGGDKASSRVHDIQTGMLVQQFTQQAGPVVGGTIITSTADPVPNTNFEVITASSSGLYRWTAAWSRTMVGHSQAITSLHADSQRERHVYSGSLDGTIRCWNIDNGQAVQQINIGGPVTSIAISNDGQRIAASSDNRTARLFQNNGQQIVEMRGDIRLKIAQTRAQQHVNSANARQSVAKRLSDEAEADLPRKQSAEKTLTDSLTAVNKEVEDKKALVAKALADKIAAEKAAIEASTAAKAAIAEKENAELLAKNAASAMQVAQGKLNQLQQTLNLKPDNEKLKQLVATTQQEVVTGQQTSQQLASGVTAPTQKALEMANAANTAAQKVIEMQKPFNDAGTELKTAISKQNLIAQQHVIAVQEAKSAQALSPLRKDVLARADAAKVDAEKQLATANENLQKAEMPIRSIAFSEDGLTLLTGGDFPNVHLWDGKTGAAVAAFVGHTLPIRQVISIGNGEMLTASDDQTLRVWKSNPEWGLERTIGKLDDPTTIAHRATSVDFNRDSTQLLVAGGVPSRGGELQVFSVNDGSRLFYMPQAHDDVIYSARFSPDGKRAASVGADRYLRTFDIATGKQLRRFEGHTNHVLGVTWHRNGETIATSAADNTIKVWEAETGDLRFTVEQQLTKPVTSVQFIGDTDNVISSSSDKTVRIHNSTNGGLARNFPPVKAWLHCVVATPDSKVVAAGDASGTVTLWDGNNGQVIRTLKP